jgi:hypothetical protein
MTEVKCNVCGAKMTGKSQPAQDYFSFPLGVKGKRKRVMQVFVQATMTVRNDPIDENYGGYNEETDVCNNCQQDFWKKVLKVQR